MRRRCNFARACEGGQEDSFDAFADSSIGARLLRGMGWRRGKGLGKKEQGQKAPVSDALKPRKHMRGLGYVNKQPRKKARLSPGPTDRPGFGDSVDDSGPAVLRRAARIRVRGLTSAAGIKYNGKIAIVSHMQVESGRYIVHMVDGGVAVSLRGECFTQLIGGATLVGLLSRPELNGRTGILFDFDEASGRYTFHLDGSLEVVRVKPSNIIFPSGTIVRVSGLVSAAGKPLNGKWGRILSWDVHSNRCVVQVDACIGKHKHWSQKIVIKKLKLDNFRV